MLSNIFAGKIINNTDEVEVVKNSYSYPLIKELSHKFGWRVCGLSTDSESIEAGRQAFNLVDKYSMPVATAYVAGDWNYVTSTHDIKKYVVESRYMHTRSNMVSSTKLPYVIRNVNKKCDVVTRGQDYVYKREAYQAIAWFQSSLKRSIGQTNISIHSVGLSSDDIYKLLDSHFNNTWLNDETKYKEALDLLKVAEQNSSELLQRKKDYLENPFYMAHSFRDKGVYLTKVIMSGGELKVLEYPKYYDALSELESEFPVLTMMKVILEDDPPLRYSSGTPQLDKFYEGLDVASYYNICGGTAVSFLVLPCQTV